MIIDYDKFKKVTKYDIKTFFQRFTTFINNQYGYIVSYYSGGDLNQDAFFELDSLLNECLIIEPLFTINSNRLNTLDMWNLLDMFTDIQVKLWTIKNSGKWLKSSRMNTNSIGTKINRIQSQNETLEMMADNLGYGDVQNDWMNIAIDNQITEEDYTLSGGVLVTVTMQNNFSVGLDNIVDYTVGQNVLGKDIYRQFTFENNDLKTVEYKDAINQSFNIKISCQKNSIPEFPEYGVNNEIIGSNVAIISYPTIFRDLLNLFRQDKRWSTVNLLDLKRDKDMVFMKFEAITILKDSKMTNIAL